MRIVSTLAILAMGAASPALAQAKPGNCAIYAEMTADTVRKDKRIKGAEAASIAEALDTYAEAQRAIVERDMPQTYAQSKAFGWDKATVDKKIKEGEDALRAGFRTPTMEADKVYMDHVMAVYNCANAAKSPDELGQSPEAMVAALETLSQRAQGR